MLARKRMLSQSGGTPGGGVVEKSRLTAQRTLAIRRQDYDEVAQIDVKIAKLAESAAPVDQREDVLARVNERNRKANMEAVRRAEVLEAERKRRERKTQRENGQQASVLDPSARLRTIPRLFESATPTSRCVILPLPCAYYSADASRPATPNPATLGVATPKKGLSPSPTPKLNGGKTFEASIIDSIEVDLGDF
jgi:RNA polymerase-associated protein RTF1